MNTELTKKDRGWLLPDCRNQKTPPGLYLVATPIGNLGDITIRALDMLSSADMIVCEDKRVTGKLLKSYGIKNKLVTYNDHSDKETRMKIINHLESGKHIALVSDAGMPLISDPGYKLIQECITRNIHLTSFPGANAPLMALQLSGLPNDKFTFLGFLPSKIAARTKILEEWKTSSAALIMFESPNRIAKSLKDLRVVLGNRKAVIMRELTKLYEEIARGSIEDLLEIYKEKPIKGEIVMIIEGAAQNLDLREEDLHKALKDALKNMKTKEAARFISEKTTMPMQKIYDLALKIKKDQI